MAKYEILTIADPKVEFKEIESKIKTIFTSEKVECSLMDNSDLAYPIKGSKYANYILTYVTTTNTQLLEDFKRQILIFKPVWRHMIINLDTEIGIDKKPKRIKKTFTPKRPFKKRTNFVPGGTNRDVVGKSESTSKASPNE